MSFPLPTAVTQNYATEPINEYVILGNDVIMKCSVPSFMSDFISIVGWTDNSGNEFRVNSEDQKLGKAQEVSSRAGTGPGWSSKAHP